jgi:Uma2 family endonuclease
MSANRVTREAPKAPIPPLENGDRLTVAEFRRRYEAMPHVKKAELIEGVVYMPSPVRFDQHAEQHFDLITWLGTYRVATPGVQGGDNATLQLPLGVNEPQPDAFLRVCPDHGGQSKTSEDGYVVGAPEWVGEIAASSAGYDLHDKFRVYQRNGVQEYVVWCIAARSIDWFLRRGDTFHPMRQRGGVFKSTVFPGLWLDATAMLDRDMAKVMRVLQKGLKSDAHRRFVARLAKHKR